MVCQLPARSNASAALVERRFLPVFGDQHQPDRPVAFTKSARDRYRRMVRDVERTGVGDLFPTVLHQRFVGRVRRRNFRGHHPRRRHQQQIIVGERLVVGGAQRPAQVLRLEVKVAADNICRCTRRAACRSSPCRAVRWRGRAWRRAVPRARSDGRPQCSAAAGSVTMAWSVPSSAIAAQIGMPIGCHGMDTSLTLAPRPSSTLAAARTPASTSGWESYCPKPSCTTPILSPAMPCPIALV